MTRRVTILGATGSIGEQTADLIRREPEAFDVVALTGARNVARLAEMARELRAEVAVTADEARLPELRAALAGSGIEAAGGTAAVAEAAARPADWIMSAIVGSAGLAPTLRAAEQGTVVALANKESLVCAGALVKDVCTRAGAMLLPVDSEHSALFQSMQGERREDVARVILTASGGPFRDWPLQRMETATVAEAVAHPNWDMGQRISIDSASMFNKSLEVIEAKVLFDLEPDEVEVVVHPQSIIHSLVGYRDGSVMAQLGVPDMRGAIGYALNYPERRPLPVAPLDLAAIGTLDFRAPDLTRFPALGLARRVMETGGLAGAAFNAAKEAAMDAFLDGRAGFLDMARLVEEVLDAMPDLGARTPAEAGLAGVLETDREARARVAERVAVAAE